MPGPLGYRNPLSRFEVTMLAWCESLVRGRGENGQAGPSRGERNFLLGFECAEWKEILPQRMPNSKG
ncbi:hypothetical protein TNCV_1020921 [Trichonephila clavipes]|uniref:Uncharacterized protein n=1 Tax=Trichonephila clavipes TaxID=2585209 RepID=A0A8X6SI98_TRICX|nr:hypothetical protein TNCV_1020921 [Trichonephila clavipes]